MGHTECAPPASCPTRTSLGRVIEVIVHGVNGVNRMPHVTLIANFLGSMATEVLSCHTMIMNYDVTRLCMHDACLLIAWNNSWLLITLHGNKTDYNGQWQCQLRTAPHLAEVCRARRAKACNHSRHGKKTQRGQRGDVSLNNALTMTMTMTISRIGSIIVYNLYNDCRQTMTPTRLYLMDYA